MAGEVKYREPMQLFKNQRNGTFEDVSAASGLVQMPLASHRGTAFGDINNDGNIDFVTLNVGQPPTVVINRTRNENHRVLFRLVGTKSNRAAIGARITVHAGKLVSINEVKAGSSYLSQNDLRLHFGLGAEKVMQTVEVRWPNGEVETMHNVAADAIYTVYEGQGIKDRKSFGTR
jgi:hypothetical protein